MPAAGRKKTVGAREGKGMCMCPHVCCMSDTQAGSVHARMDAPIGAFIADAYDWAHPLAARSTTARAADQREFLFIACHPCTKPCTQS